MRRQCTIGLESIVVVRIRCLRLAERMIDRGALIPAKRHCLAAVVDPSGTILQKAESLPAEASGCRSLAIT